jgi:hypothetical protein
VRPAYVGHIQKKSITRREARLSLEEARDVPDSRPPSGGQQKVMAPVGIRQLNLLWDKQ